MAIFFVSCASTSAKSTKAEIVVKGNCGQCEERIEQAAYDAGAKSAEWNKETKVLEVYYNPNKVSEEELTAAILEKGHDVGDQTGNPEAYDALPGCCKFRETSCDH